MARNHKKLVKLARSHRTREELVRRVSIFDTGWWKREKERIKQRVAKQGKEKYEV